jgi:HK97 family phage prohead protease
MKDVKHRYGTICRMGEDVDDSRTVTFIGSTYTKDRHGTVLNQANWKLDRFNANPIVGYQHNVYGGDMCNAPDPDDVIGKARAYVENDQLMFDITFEPREINEKADKLFQKVRFGSLNAVSVGFVPIGVGRFGEGAEREGGENQTYYFDGQELLEISLVNIPSNPDAIKKSVRDSTANALMYIKRNLGSDVSFTEIEKMTVGEVIKMLDGEDYIIQEQKNNKELKKKRQTYLNRLKIGK